MDIFHTKLRAIAFKSGICGDLRRSIFKTLYLFVLFPLIAFTTANASESPPLNVEGATTITAEKLIEMAGSMPNLVIIDARKQADWERGHIDGTIHIANTEMTEQSLAAVTRRDQPVAFLCNGPTCRRSEESSKNAVRWGWKKIFWFRGGIVEWSKKGFPLTK